MYLYEEYANRFNLNCSIFKREDKSLVYLRNNKIICVEKKLNFNQPHSHEVFICCPEKNITGGSSFFKVINKYEVEWNDYDNFILNFCKSNNNALCKYDEVFIRSWEIFIYYNDQYFLENINYNILFKTIDLNNKNIIKDIEHFIDFLKIHNTFYYEMWKKMKKNVDNYSYWLSNLINSL